MCIITQGVINLARMYLGMVGAITLVEGCLIFELPNPRWYLELCSRVVLRQVSMLPRAVCMTCVEHMINIRHLKNV
jgi:hypothetical protein